MIDVVLLELLHIIEWYQLREIGCRELHDSSDLDVIAWYIGNVACAIELDASTYNRANGRR